MPSMSSRAAEALKRYLAHEWLNKIERESQGA
jgi:hypothetical protein